MKRTKKTLAFVVTMVILIMGTQLAAFAATSSSLPETSVASKAEVSSAVERSVAESAPAPITTTTNPSTGQSGIALPLAVTLMAVAGAPLLLKKK